MAEAHSTLMDAEAYQEKTGLFGGGNRRVLVVISVPVFLILAAITYYFMTSYYVSTDNAYVHQHKVSISPEVTGRVVQVLVSENQRVKAGDILFRLDDEPYRIAIAQADATIAAAQVKVESLGAAYSVKNAAITTAAEAVGFYQKEYQRQSALMGQGFTTKARLQAAKHALNDARNQLGESRAEAVEAQAAMATGAAVPGINPAVAAALAQRQKALLDLHRTVVRAPYDGVISQSDKLQQGQMLISGLPALTLVAANQSWVDANFKETDLDKMRVGQPAEVTFDAYPDLKLKGHVASIGAGTGAEFSILPAQNASGNWVKVTQRVPVRVAIDDKSPRQLIAGQSAHVRVDTRSGK